MSIALMRLHYFVAGTPIPQGSKRAWYNPAIKQVTMLEDAGSRHTSWRWELSSYARQAMSDAGWITPFEGPILCSLNFLMHRNIGHYGTGRNSKAVKRTAPSHPIVAPDVDKLARAVLDSLTSIVWVDDAQVVRLTATKNYVERWEEEGVAVTVSTWS